MSAGGAIYSTGNIQISGSCAFANNNCPLDGGAIYTTGAVTINTGATAVFKTGATGCKQEVSCNVKRTV